MDEKILNALKDFGDTLSARFNSAGEYNLELSAEYLKEQSYRLSNIYITLNFAVLSAASFVLSNRNLNNFSKFLVVFLLCSIAAIVIEIFNRKKMLKILDEDSWERMGIADDHNQKIGDAFQKYITDPVKCVEELKKVNDSFNEKNGAQLQLTKEKLKIPQARQFISEILSVISLLSLLMIATSELGIIKYILSLCRLV